VVLSFAEHASLALNHARAVEEAVHEALHDSLTGLPNRSLFLDRLRHAVVRAERTGTPLAVLFCDLDGFKTVNDSLGHRTGDRLLVSVADRLARCLRPTDTIARLGGDEFAVLLEELRGPDDAARMAQRLLDSLEPQFQLREREFFISASIGIATGTKEAETLLRDADLAMYRAKSSGKGRYAIYEPGMHTAIVDRLDLEVDLKGAIERDELVLAYQPVFDLRSGEVAGVEALVRWQHPTRGLVLPEHFVPLAEESGMIRELGRWVLRTAAHQGALWRAKYPGHPGFRVGVNVSGAQLREPGFVEEVAEALAIAQLDGSGLTLEITETALMGSFETAIEQLRELKRLGVDLAIDDFGIGYSSLRYLRRLPLDALKIERSFVEGIGRPDDEPELLRAIVDLADIFGLEVIAEGIERPEQRERLLELGCDRGQGHLLSEPLDAAGADALLFRVGLLGGPAAPGETASGDDEPPAVTIEPETDRGAD
jgi:diguanylate cyclase (GGDEF)-like protein